MYVEIFQARYLFKDWANLPTVGSMHGLLVRHYAFLRYIWTGGLKRFCNKYLIGMPLWRAIDPVAESFVPGTEDQYRDVIVSQQNKRSSNLRPTWSIRMRRKITFRL